MEPFAGADERFAEYPRRSSPLIRLSDMDEDRILLEHYRAAWAQFETSVQTLQAACAAGSGEGLKPLFLEVETARLKYASTRDRLVSQMLAAETSSGEPASDETRIRGSAHLLWEFGGRRANSAEKDWLRAEAMVRLSLTAN
jgi:hypothetical protein